MRAAVFILITITLSAIGAQAQSKTRVAASVNPYREADSLFTFAEDAERDKQSLATIEQALATGTSDYQWLWRAARAYFYVGDEADKDDKQGYFQKGIAIAQRAIAAEPSAVEGHFWLAANYGGSSELVGALKALQTVKKIRAEMETVLRLNDRYQDGGAYLALGEMDKELPRIVGGSLSRAITRLETGLKIAPHNLEIKLALAEAYSEDGRKEDARRQLKELLAHPINLSHPKTDRNAQDKARTLLAKL
ncbi:MAG: TRAP transporter TatT component family protein [Blastocatellia bacterium]